jgi:DNA-binding Lrp family transcriptional regulator
MDALDRRIAAALQLDGRASWQRISRAVGASESTVSRRTQRMIGSGELRVVAIADPVRCGFGHWVILQVRCEIGEAPRVARALAEREDVRYLSLVTGPYDIVVEMIVPSRRYLSRVLMEELPRVEGLRETTTRMVLRNFKMAYDWSRELLGERAAELEYPGEGGDGVATYELDEVELRLYELLLEDGRRSYSELAELAGVSESKARRRVESLRERGCIKFATLIDPPLLGYGVECVCWVRVDLARLEETAQSLAGLPQVRYISATIDYSDLVCEVVLRSHEELYEFCTGTLGGLVGVQEVNVNLKLQTVKQAYLHLSDPDFGAVGEVREG